MSALNPQCQPLTFVWNAAAGDDQVPNTNTIASEDEEKEAEDEDLAAYLTALSTPGIDIINTRDWDLQSSKIQHCLKHLHPKFLTYFEGQPMTFLQNLEAQRVLAEIDPTYHIQISHVETTIDAKNGTASVFMYLKVRGLAGVKMEGMSELEWKFFAARHGQGEKKERKWWCMKGHSMRGSNAGCGGFI